MKNLFRAHLAVLVMVTALLVTACGGPPPRVTLQQPIHAPAVYRISASAQSSFSGPISNLKGGTQVTAAFKTQPISATEVDVEVLYFAASVQDADGEPVALNLEPLAGRKAKIEFRSPGIVSNVSGDPKLLNAPIPLIPVPSLISALFPPMPQESMQKDDTWLGDVPVPFSNLSGPPGRMRYVLTNVDPASQTASAQGYLLATEPRPFVASPVGERVSGAGDLNILFNGEYDAQRGYLSTVQTAKFDSQYIRLGAGGSNYANGSVHLDYKATTERLNSVEQFGMDPGGAATSP